MQIPGGDLAPARRRRYGGGYGRRRRRRSILVGLGVVLAVAAVAWIATRDHPKAPARAVVVHRCPSPSPSQSALLQPRQVRLTLLNGTSRNGLAKTVKAELVARGFVVLDAANAPAALAGPSRVAYGPGGQQAAAVVSRHVLGAVAVGDPTAAAGTVVVTLGGDYSRLATATEAVPSSSVPSPSASPCV